MVRERGARPEPPKRETRGRMPEMPAPPALPKPIDWWTLNNFERRQTLIRLKKWVCEFVHYFNIRDSEIPPCWYLHSPIVQELLAFMQFRQQQQLEHGRSPAALLEVHVQLQMLLQRLNRWVNLTGCNAAEHNEFRTQAWISQGHQKIVWEQEFLEHLDFLEAVAEQQKQAGADVALLDAHSVEQALQAFPDS